MLGRLTAVTAAATAAVLLAGAPAQAYGLPPGNEGSGDTYFPYAGNMGYDVSHYDLALDYAPPNDPKVLEGHLEGVATINLTVGPQSLDAFTLDLRGLDVRSVTVDGAKLVRVAKQNLAGRGTYVQVQDPAKGAYELGIAPPKKLAAGKAITVVVAYGGTTGRPIDTGGALYGFVTTPDGALVANEPEAAPTWFPVNDTPKDKATYSFHITVPAGKTAVANGLPVGKPVTKDGKTTWNWDAKDQMASYLATASIGDYDLSYQTGPHGLPIINAVDRKLTPKNLAETKAALKLQPQMIAFYESLVGRYPFESFGAIVDDDSVDYALETQTRPVYSEVANESTVAHELAHQWFGDSVSPSVWKDVWLNEGWATYGEWSWGAHRGGPSVAQQFADAKAYLDRRNRWALDITDPGRDEIFASQVYLRGGAALQALRQTVGERGFQAGAKLWLSTYKDQAAATDDFQQVYKKATGRDLTDFFDVWLRNPVKPAGA